MSFEESLVKHASPTLANIKVANLYNFKFDSLEECQETITRFNSIMNSKGIYIELLKCLSDSYLIYVYRQSSLKNVLGDTKIKNFLKSYGYFDESNLRDYFGLLKSRLYESRDFPHEIGIFLGYPLEDVKAFIELKGQDYCLCGDWKVYHNEQSARCLFCKYKHCREVYEKVYGEGKQLIDMLVSA